MKLASGIAPVAAFEQRGGSLVPRNRRRGVQRRPSTVRGDGFRGQAREGLDARSDRASGAPGRSGGDGRRSPCPRPGREDRVPRVRKGGGPDPRRCPSRPFRAGRRPFCAARFVVEGGRRDRRLGGRQAPPPAGPGHVARRRVNSAFCRCLASKNREKPSLEPARLPPLLPILFFLFRRPRGYNF